MRTHPSLPRAAVWVLLLASVAVRADDGVVGKMRALFPKADADRNGTLSADEQARAVGSVKDTYGEVWAERVAAMFARAAKGGGKEVGAEGWKAEVDAYAQPAPRTTEQVAMSDGTRLATDIHLPRGDGPFPVVLARTPYGRVKRGKEGEGFTRDGYAFVIQDMRGRFDSQGENLPFLGCGWSEHQDGVDTVAWLKRQPWCNGRIATIGGSAGGITQNLLAAALPDGLAAQFISVAASCQYEGACYIGGAFRKADIERWLADNRFDPRALETARSHPGYDAHWEKFDTTRRFDRMNAPAVHVGGWFDMFQQSTIDQFVGRQHHGGPGARGKQKLVMGQWAHAIGKMPVGELAFPDANRLPPRYDPERWFAHHLQGLPNGVEKEPAVAYYVMGDTSTPGAPGNEWRFAADWPVPSTETPFHLTKERRLDQSAPAASDAFLEFTFDPANPCPTVGGNNLTLARGPMDQRRVEGRGDALVFTSRPLDRPMEVTGRVRARIFLSSSTADTDLSVRLCDVYPDGRSLLIAEGIRRLRYRNSPVKPEPLTPGRIEEVEVDCWSTSMVFHAGHRLRVMVTSSNYPRFDLNPGTGLPWSDEGEKVRQTNRIHCDGRHPSRLLLPVVQ